MNSWLLTVLHSLLLGVAISGFSLPASAAADRPAPFIESNTWFNSGPLTMESLRGKVILVDFWTFGCYNCQNVEPYIKQWYEAYGDKGLAVVGVHAPEFSFERKLENLKNYIARQEIKYPIAVDNDFDIWHAWHNRAWPAIYLVDKKGMIRYQRIGEGGYETTEGAIRQLLAE